MDRVTGETNIYGFTPTKHVCIIFIVTYAITTILHLGQATARRQWFMFPTAIICGVLEVVGWAGRLWSHYDVYEFTAFQIQILCTLVAPTPLLATIFVIFGRIMIQLGPQYSRLSPKRYTVIFCSCDVLALAVQGAGGAIAATASDGAGGDKKIAMGSDIMLAGIVFQSGVIVMFTALALETYMRFRRDTPVKRTDDAPRGELTRNVQYMLLGLMLSTLCLFIRSLFRVAELADGWDGRIMQTERYFNWLDGAMVTLSIYTFNFAHPGWLLAGINVFPGTTPELTTGSSIETHADGAAEKGVAQKTCEEVGSSKGA